MKKINISKITELLKGATDVFIHQNKLIIDIEQKRIIVNDIYNGEYYLELFKNKKIESPEIIDCFYSEEKLKLILKYYPTKDKRDWLASKLRISRAQLNDKYKSMLICYDKNNRYSRQYWKEELDELKSNKNNLEYHIKKYNRNLKSLKDIIRQYEL